MSTREESYSGYPLWIVPLTGAPAPGPDPHPNAVRIYADENQDLRTIKSDGTDAPIGGGGSQPALHGALMYGSGSFDPLGGDLVTLNGVDFDSDGYANVGANGFVIPAGLGGAYLFVANSDSHSTTAPTELKLWVDFTDEPNVSNPEIDFAPPDGDWNVGMTAMGQFPEGSTITLRAQIIGGTDFVLSSRTFGLTYLGPLS